MERMDKKIVKNRKIKVKTFIFLFLTIKFKLNIYSSNTSI